VIPLWIATQAVRRQIRTIGFESASQILHEWGLPQNGSHYRRLADGFRRIFGSAIFFGTSEAMVQAEVWGLRPAALDRACGFALTLVP
jgi:hypothetical protein